MTNIAVRKVPSMGDKQVAKSNSLKSVNVLNARLLPVTLPELLEQFTHGLVVFHNLDTLGKLQRVEEFANVCHGAEFSVADGKMVVYAARFLGHPVPAKISGADFLGAFCERHGDDPEVRVFLLGAGPGVAAKAARHINTRIGRDIVVDVHSPSFGFEADAAECDEIVQRVNRSGATVLVVGAGAPKQELWIARHRHLMPTVSRFMAVGATLDFEAGAVPRAPHWMSEHGLEWLFRLGHEPRRLWRRYLWECPQVLGLVMRDRVGSYENPFASNVVGVR